MPFSKTPASKRPIAIRPLCPSYSVLVTYIWSEPSLSIRGPGIHLMIDSNNGPRSSARSSGDNPAFPFIPLAYIT
ncbi:hypothetical protein MtrunA17_Chr1g0173561 [Medicago truncatula]|uniref:Uncharacterized protein n=1 Tax=Medicago truncatula TaxID=3880 RepID=A0A396JLF8_MEDTR|nr:hypothetical protein MtrunA17_Chr1g0173561 [Medicago truncatula]